MRAHQGSAAAVSTSSVECPVNARCTSRTLILNATPDTAPPIPISAAQKTMPPSWPCLAAAITARTKRLSRSNGSPASDQFNRHPLAHGADELIRRGAGGRCDLLDGQALAPQLDRDTEMDPRQARDVHRDHVHRHSAGERGAVRAD